MRAASAADNLRQSDQDPCRRHCPRESCGAAQERAAAAAERAADGCGPRRLDELWPRVWNVRMALPWEARLCFWRASALWGLALSDTGRLGTVLALDGVRRLRARRCRALFCSGFWIALFSR